MITDIIIKINVEGAAFEPENGNAFEYETSRILKEIASALKEGRIPTSIMDINGNKACSIEYVKE